MGKWIGLLAFFVVGLATVFVSNLLAETGIATNPKVEIKKEIVQNTSPVPVSPLGRIQNMQKMRVLQQRHQMQASLFKMYEERQNINAALETIEKNRLKSQAFSNPSFAKNADKQEKFLKERLRTLVTDISALDKQLNAKK